jgi:hypothetical protein
VRLLPRKYSRSKKKKKTKNFFSFYSLIRTFAGDEEECCVYIIGMPDAGGLRKETAAACVYA